MKQKHEAHMKQRAHMSSCTCILNTFASSLLHRVNGVLLIHYG